MSEQKEKACCFTGHRAAKIPYLVDDQHPNTIKLKEALRNEIFGYAMADCYDFYMGCCDGADVVFGELVLEVAQTHALPLRLICVPPYIGFEKKLQEPWRSRCEALLQAAAEVIRLADHLQRGGYHIRDRYMVDHSSDLLAIYNGGSGGTAYTIDYALKHQRNATVFSISNGCLWVSANEQLR